MKTLIKITALENIPGSLGHIGEAGVNKVRESKPMARSGVFSKLRIEFSRPLPKANRIFRLTVSELTLFGMSTARSFAIAIQQK